MTTLNCISQNPHFVKSALYTSFREDPIGFVDVGASGGIDPLVWPVASLIHCHCFEPEKNEALKLLKMYDRNSIFSEISIHDIAITEEGGEREIHVTRSKVNTSLLEPNGVLESRYNLAGFHVLEKVVVKSKSLDEVFFDSSIGDGRAGEILKLDCQGAEFEILQGGQRLLDERCVCVKCEVEFFQMYKDQKVFSEIDELLQTKGFQLYGLSPNYISTKKLDRTKFETEERVAWADALYFKDPFDANNLQKDFSRRSVDVLFLCALMSGYFDFALELVAGYGGEKERGHLENLILELSSTRRKSFESDIIALMENLHKSPEMKFLFAKKFVDEHSSNNNIDFIRI